ncbi:MAG: hypothetical protein GEU99_07340 [Luteitalea sp.]|nr:hypothetical protein [Luteitalea sp.]
MHEHVPSPFQEAKSEESAAALPERSPAPQRIWRVTRTLLLLTIALLAAASVSLVTIDLGPSLRTRAEHEGSRRIQRPMHIGRLSVRLLTGRFLLENVVIEGLTPEARPFLVAKRIEVGLPWWTLFRRELLLDTVEMRDWRMLIETFPGGRHNFPKFTSPQPRASQGNSRRIVTTLRLVRAVDGHLTFADHGTPWSTEAANLDIVVTKSDKYRGRATFHDGQVRIQDFVPMSAAMRASFTIEGGLVHFDRIDLDTDGARSGLVGSVNLGRWPEQVYRVESRVDFRRQRELFFAHERFRVGGNGSFSGTFRLFKGGHELKGRFASQEAGLNDYRFGNLRGSLMWTSDRFQVTNATSNFLGGTTRFHYAMWRQAVGVPRLTRFEAAYRDVDLAAYSDLINLTGLRLAGRASGENVLEYPLGRFNERRGGGRIQVLAPPGVSMQGRFDARPNRLRPGRVPSGPDKPGLASGPRLAGRRGESAEARSEKAEGRAYTVSDAPSFDRDRPLGRVPLAGALAYRYSPDWVSFERGELATPSTYVAFAGRTAWGDESSIPFHVTSRDWQESDRLLAGIMTAAGRPREAIEIGGRGEFDGVLTGAIGRPRIEGRFDSYAVRAWDVVWGHTTGDVVVDDGYATVKGGRVRQNGATIDVNGRFALGLEPADGREAINARFRVAGRPIADLRHAFGVDDYPLDGVLSGEFHLYGRYQAPFGYGRMTIERGTAWREPFDAASAGLRFEGTAVRLDGIEMRKAKGRITGAAHVGWNGTYSFNADARQIPIDAITRLPKARVPLTGQLRFTASGSGTFESPRYVVRAGIDDLHAGEETVGQVSGQLSVGDGTLAIKQLEVASARLALSGAGHIALTDRADGDLSFRFNDTSLDPYARLLFPKLSADARAVASGTIRLVGAFAHLPDLRGEAKIERFDLSVLDYRVHNDGLLRFSLGPDVLSVDRLRVVGDGTALEVAGNVRLDSRRVNLGLLGDANLSILPGFVRDVRSSGAAEVQATVRGVVDQPEIVGSAILADARVRHFALPHAVEQLNGRVTFDATGVLVDGLTGRVGGGPVRFGGRIGLQDFALSEYGLTASGTNMRVRFPSSFRSTVDAELALRGAATAPTLSGRVSVRDAVLVQALDTAGAGVFGLTAVGPLQPPPTTTEKTEKTEKSVPLQLDVRVEAPGTIRVENREMRLAANTDLTLRGTYDQPQLFGHGEIVRGEIFAEGKRYDVTRGVVSFSNPTKIEPFFDVEAETRAQVPGQVYRVTLRASGTPERFVFNLSSDPPLAEVDILGLLFGDTADPQDAELRALREPNQAERDLIATRALRLLANPVSSEVGRAAEVALGVDSVQITPALGDLSAETAAGLDPGARLTIGKRFSDRVYLTYGRLLTSSRRDQLILLEYNQSDRLSWVLSQNEDETYAVDVRVRHVF